MNPKSSCLAILCQFVALIAFPSPPGKQQTNLPVRTVITGYLPYAQHFKETISLMISEENLSSPYRLLNTTSCNGYFRYEFPLSNITSVSFTLGANPLMGMDSLGVNGMYVFIEPGDSMHITVPTRLSRISGDVTFQGKGTGKQTFLRALNKRRLAQMRTDGLDYSLEKARENKQMIEEELHRNREVLGQNAANNIKSALVGVLNSGIIAQFEYMDLTNTEVRKRYETEYAKYFPLTDLYVHHAGHIKTHKSLPARIYIDYLVANGLPFDGPWYRNTKRTYSIFSKSALPVQVQNKVLAELIVWSVKRYGYDDDRQEITHLFLSKTPPEDPYRKEVEAFIGALKENIGESVYAKDFILTDTAGNKVLLANFQGKVVLLDFLFTGCGSCKVLAPELATIEEHYEKKNITFISISVDPNLVKFRKGVGVFSSPTSIPLYTSGEGSDHPIVRHFAIMAYPTLVLLRKDGKVVSDRMPEPILPEGKKELMRMIDETLLK